MNKLAGNPIVLDVYTGANLSGRFRIYIDSVLSYDGYAYSFGGTAQVDVSELYESMADIAGIKQCVMVTVNADGEEYVPAPGEANSSLYTVFNVFGGRVNDLMVRFLKRTQDNVVDKVLKNQSGNFLLTTRTASRIVTIPENELDKLYYYGKGFNFGIYHAGILLATFNHSTDTVESLKSIDLAQLRIEKFYQLNKLVSHFDISVGSNYAFSIVITEQKPATYRLKFKNSWGVDELIAITGDLLFMPEISESLIYQRYDSIIEKLANKSMRKTYKATYTADLGFRTYDERMFILDALLSNDVKLVTPDGEFECMLSSTIDVFDNAGTEPIPLTVKITLNDKLTASSNMNAGVDTGNTLIDEFEDVVDATGVFDETFDETFD